METRSDGGVIVTVLFLCVYKSVHVSTKFPLSILLSVVLQVKMQLMNLVYLTLKLYSVLNYRTYPALETLTEPHQLTATLNCVIGVARSLVSGSKWFPEGPTHMLPLLMRALPGVDPNDFSKCMVSILMILFCSCYCC